MKIIGFGLTKVLAERKEKQEDKVTITQNIDIKEVLKDKINFSNDEILKVHFSFNINYAPDFAKLEFNGNVALLPEKKELDDFLKSWKDKKIPEESKVPLFNFIMSKCNIKALNLEDEMGLPLHVPMPKLTNNPKEKK